MTSTRGALDGIRVIDLAGEPGVFAARQLAELGADVIRVEPPGGDRVRSRLPFLAHQPGMERSLYHLHHNAGKRSVVLDLGRPEDRDRLRRLAADADVLIETAAPGAMDEIGLGYDDLVRVNPRLLYVTITPYGQAGPLRDAPGNDLTAVASSGLMYLNGFPEDPPNQPAAEQGYHMGSLVAVATTLVTLVGRDRDAGGRGHRIDVSLQEAASMATLQTANANLYAWHGVITRRPGIDGPAAGARSLFQCADGLWISFAVPLGSPALWQAFVDWMREEGFEEEYADPSWDDPSVQAQRIPVTTQVIERLCARRERSPLFHEGQRRRMLVMPVNDATDLLDDPHLRERGFFRETTHTSLGRTLVDVGPPYRFSATPAHLGRAPTLGEHTDEVLRDLAEPAPNVAPTLYNASDGPWRPLDAVRVADFCWMIAGPATTRMLADYGADVIKIESQSRIDNIRTIGVQPSRPGTIETNGVFWDCNTGKRSVTLNLNHPRGIELAKELVRVSDVVTNNFTADRMDRWGLGYEELRKANPDIIMLTMPVMGTTGPYKRYGSYGNGIVAFGGLNQGMGFAHRPPTGMAAFYSDFAVPYFAVTAVMAALHHRERTGEGQLIELAQAEATLNLLGPHILECSANGDLPPRLGNRSRDDAPHGAFRCAGDDRWVALAVRDAGEWRRLANVIGRDDLAADDSLASPVARRARDDEIVAAVEAWTGNLDAWEAARALQAAGVPAAVVEDLEDMLTRDPRLSRQHLLPLQRAGEDLVFRVHAQPARIDGQASPLRPPPLLGEHNEAVFKDLLGLTDTDYADLLADGVFS